MIHKQQREGFILVLTLLVLSLAVVLVNQFYVAGTVTLLFDKTMIDREKAQTLAYGAIALAESQLAVVKKQEKNKEKEKETKEQHKEEKKFLERIVPIINRWQEFTLQTKTDGINATIKLCISCEDGKLNINQLWDFEKKKFIQIGGQKSFAKDAEKTTQQAELQLILQSLKKFSNFKDIAAPFEKFLKDRQYKLNDVTELLQNKEIAQAFQQNIFYEPPETAARATSDKRPVYLMDLFTIFSATGKLEPWLLSDSVAAVFGLTRAQADDSEKRKKEVVAVTKEFKPTIVLEKDWNTLFKPLYGKEFKSITKETQAMFQTTFEPKTFSVLIHATVGTITQKLYVILHRTHQDSYQQFTVQRLYWL